MTSPAPRPPTWREVLDAQRGVLSREQALQAGMTPRGWDWRHSAERLSSLMPGVSLRGGGTPDDDQIGWAAVLHCGVGAAATGDLGLLLFGFRFQQRPTRLHVAVPEGRVRRQADLVCGDAVLRVVPRQVRGLEELRHPVKEPPRLRLPVAALHAAALAPSDRAAEWRVAAAVQQRLTTPQRLTSALDGMPRLRRRRLIRIVLEDVARGAHSGSELAFLRLLRGAGLPLPDRLQLLVRPDGKRYLDAWWAAQRLAVEIDGAHHVEAGQWDADVLRANAIVVAERENRVLLLRYTTGNLRHDRADVVRQLSQVLLPAQP